MINRRDLIVGAAVTGALSVTACAIGPTAAAQRAGPEKFRMKFAPHDGMFRHSAGEDIVDQIHFVADQGFTAWEDNGLAGRSVETQIRIGEALAAREMQMGVYVAGMPGGFWQNQPVFSGKDPSHREAFLALITEQAETARVFARKDRLILPKAVRHAGNINAHLHLAGSQR
ncbi:MAG: hypothetical protein AAGJ51_06870, partial [Pseudomonadota bacterium]